MDYRILDHTADLGLEVTAETPQDLYKAAAAALFELMTDVRILGRTRTCRIDVEGDNPADLLVNFFRELLWAFNGEGFLARECVVVNLSATRLEALLEGDTFDPDRHRLIREIKAVTYHHTEVGQLPGGRWVARVIFDV